jgi:hypothetical protein
MVQKMGFTKIPTLVLFCLLVPKAWGLKLDFEVAHQVIPIVRFPALRANVPFKVSEMGVPNVALTLQIAKSLVTLRMKVDFKAKNSHLNKAALMEQGVYYLSLAKSGLQGMSYQDLHEVGGVSRSKRHLALFVDKILIAGLGLPVHELALHLDSPVDEEISEYAGIIGQDIWSNYAVEVDPELAEVRLYDSVQYPYPQEKPFNTEKGDGLSRMHGVFKTNGVSVIDFSEKRFWQFPDRHLLPL